MFVFLSDMPSMMMSLEVVVVEDDDAEMRRCRVINTAFRQSMNVLSSHPGQRCLIPDPSSLMQC